MLEFNHARAHIRLSTMKEIKSFVQLLNSDGTTDRYTIENSNIFLFLLFLFFL